MKGTSHVIIGAAAGVAVAHVMHGDTLAAAAIGGLFALAPDIDTEESALGRRLPHWWHALTPGHRGVTHSLAWCAAVTALAYGAQCWLLTRPPESPFLVFVVLAGLLSHLAADACTIHGVPLLWPVRIKVGLPWPLAFRTGTWPERVVTVAVTAGVIWWTYGLGDLLDGVRGRLA